MKKVLLIFVFWYAVLFSGAAVYASAGSEKTAIPPPPSHSTKKTEASSSLSGKVVETMNSGGYTYLCLERSGKKTWFAVPEMKVSEGQEITLKPGQEMTNFTSKTLNRTFEKIIFSAGPVAVETDVNRAADKPAHTVPGSKGAVITSVETATIEKASGPNAYTVAELYAERARLHKKNVAVRGKVVKVTPHIMGKNWIHLQDGSGDPKKGTHNVVVTSPDLPSVGDVVTMSGTLYKNKDYGSGYFYKVIVEKASISH